MSLADVLEKLYTRRRFGIRPGVDRVCDLLARLGNPEKKFRCIHVVGTNGKGSTSAFLSSILTHAGYRTAQFSSPHLVRFTERFRINGVEYPADSLADSLDAVLDAAPEEATFFEITTALAALVFSEEKVELAVIEAGMGGRSDATAAMAGEMTLVTPIAFDHSEYLGTTLSDIATEKAGIIEAGTPVLCAEQESTVLPVIQRQCCLGNNAIQIYGGDFSAAWNKDDTLDYSGIRKSINGLVPGIPGRYQGHNAALAIAAAEVLDSAGTPISDDAIKQGVAGSYWPGRMELIPGNPPLLLDGAHNPAGSLVLAEALSDYPRNRILLVTGVCTDKDIDLIYAPLIPLIDRIYTVTPVVDRAMNDAELAGFFSGKGLMCRPCGTVADGIRAAQSDAVAGDLVLVCGSLFVVGAVKAWLENVDYTGIRG